MNPHLTNATKDRVAARIVYEPLASVDNDGALVPFLAAEIPSLDNGGVAADGQSVTWKLKQDVQWADGESFTADDVVFTYEFVTNPAVGAGTSGSFDAVDRVEAIDDHTVVVHFKYPNPAWAVPFVGSSGVIIPRHLFESYNGPNVLEAPANRLAVGTGPYQVTAFQEEDILIIGEDIVNTIKIVYEINPHYREPDKPHFERVELRGGGDSLAAAKALFEEGSVDYAFNLWISAEEIKALEALGRARMIPRPAYSSERIQFNFSDPNRETEDGERSSIEFPHPILTDIRVRQALSLAVDREAVSALYGGLRPPTSNVLIAPTTYASPNTSWTYDLDQAAALLDEAGWMDHDGDGVRDKDGMPLRLVLQTSVNNARQQTQELVRESMGSIGVEIEPKTIDAGIFFGAPAESTNTTQHFYADLQMYSSGSDNPEPDKYMRRWACEAVAQEDNGWSGSNDSRYCNPAYDALYAQAITEIDPDRRRDLLIAMNDLLIEDAALIPLIESRGGFGLSNDIVSGEVSAWVVDTWNLAEWRRRPGT